jgi:hypothetical protein
MIGNLEGHLESADVADDDPEGGITIPRPKHHDRRRMETELDVAIELQYRRAQRTSGSKTSVSPGRIESRIWMNDDDTTIRFDLPRSPKEDIYDSKTTSQGTKGG